MDAAADIIAAHRSSSNHRGAVLAAKRCGCFHCCAEFEPSAIARWIDPATPDMQGGQTALCPKCGIDAVIPFDAAPVPRFLERMQERWFSAVPATPALPPIC